MSAKCMKNMNTTSRLLNLENIHLKPFKRRNNFSTSFRRLGAWDHLKPEGGMKRVSGIQRHPGGGLAGDQFQLNQCFNPGSLGSIVFNQGYQFLCCEPPHSLEVMIDGC